MLRFILLSFIGVAVLAFGVVGWVLLQPPPPPSAEVAQTVAPPATATYLVAVRPLRAGTLVRPDDVGPLEMVVSQAPPGARLDSRQARAETIGAMVRRSMPVGEAIRTEDVLRPGDRGFLAAILAPDMRAVTVQVDAVTGTAGLIWPGDRVDLLLTQQLQDESIPVYRRVVGETILADIRVVAIDQALVQGALGEPQSMEANRQSRTVTLEVDQRQAEFAAVATRLGTLSLIVRAAPHPTAMEVEAADMGAGKSMAAPRTAQPTPARQATTMADQPRQVWSGDVSPALRQGRPNSAPPHSLQVFSGPGRRDQFSY